MTANAHGAPTASVSGGSGTLPTAVTATNRVVIALSANPTSNPPGYGNDDDRGRPREHRAPQRRRPHAVALPGVLLGGLVAAFGHHEQQDREHRDQNTDHRVRGQQSSRADRERIGGQCALPVLPELDGQLVVRRPGEARRQLAGRPGQARAR